jgi:hypothetical protein
MNHDWTTVAVIIFGYAAGTFYQQRYVDAKFEAVHLQLKMLVERLDKIETKLEQKVVTR